MTVVINGSTGITSGSGQFDSSSTFGFKNRIINGAMMIDQRNAGASVTPTTYSYTLDRWAADPTAASKFSVQQNAGSVIPPTGFKNYLGVTSLSAYSVGASDYFALTQTIEGYNVADMGFGAVGASTFTVSFWVRSSLTGTFGGSLLNSGASRGYVFSYTINSANTWEYKTVTVTGDTSGSWNTTNGNGIQLNFSLGAGSSWTGSAGSWGASRLYAPTSSVNIVGTNGATFYITGVQLEKGSTATSFDYRSYGTELALCQRYLPAFNYSNGGDRYAATAISTTQYYANMPFQVQPRVPPTGISTSAVNLWGGYNPKNGGTGAVNGFVFSTAGLLGAQVLCGQVAGTPTIAAGDTVFLYPSTSGAQILFTGCEL